MKKLLCLALVSIMALSMSLSAVAADPAPAPSINDSLVSWWNFEGANETEYLQDKATGGTYADNLTKHGTGITFENGVAYIPSAQPNDLSLPVPSTDAQGIENMTVYVKAKFSYSEKPNTDFADLISYRGLFRIYKLKDSTSADGAVFEASAFATNNNNALGTVRVRPKSDGKLSIKAEEWFYVALTMEIKDNTGIATLYVSKDGLNYSKSEATMSFTPEILADLEARKTAGDPSAIGRLMSTSSTPTPDRYVNYWFDDLRIYSKALTETEIRTIVPNSLELRNPDELPTEAPATKAPAPTEAPTNPVIPSVPTEAPTVKTEAPTQEETKAPTAEAPAATEEKKGCGAAIGGGMALIAILACGIVSARKRED